MSTYLFYICSGFLLEIKIRTESEEIQINEFVTEETLVNS